MFYNLGFAGRAMRRIGAVEFATTIAPGLRDVLLTGKIKEIVVRNDKPDKKRPRTTPSSWTRRRPGASPGSSTSPRRSRDLAKGGPVHSQAEGVVKLLHSDLTAIHLVTLLEALPVQETRRRSTNCRRCGLRDRQRHRQPQHPRVAHPDAACQGRRGRHRRRHDPRRLDEGRHHPVRQRLRRPADRNDRARHAAHGARRERRTARRDQGARLELPALADGVDLGGLYELAEALAHQGVR